MVLISVTFFKVFENKEHVAEYMAKDAHSFELAKLISLIQKSEIKFLDVIRSRITCCNSKAGGLPLITLMLTQEIQGG